LNGRLSTPLLTGTAIEGKVLEVKKDQVRLHLSIDEAQKKEEATWFSLATPYTAGGHSGFYSPPEEGDSVHLALQGKKLLKRPRSMQKPLSKKPNSMQKPLLLKQKMQRKKL